MKLVSEWDELSFATNEKILFVVSGSAVEVLFQMYVNESWSDRILGQTGIEIQRTRPPLARLHPTILASILDKLRETNVEDKKPEWRRGLFYDGVGTDDFLDAFAKFLKQSLSPRRLEQINTFANYPHFEK
jgi:hypothetical protein